MEKVVAMAKRMSLVVVLAGIVALVLPSLAYRSIQARGKAEQATTFTRLHAERVIGPVTDAYVEGSSQDRHGIDGYWPDDGRSHPAVIVLHAGGWTLGAKEFARADCERLATLGYAAFTTNYTLASDAVPSFPAAVEDVRAAVHWVRNLTEHVDKDRIALMGYSAGGHLALLYAARHPSEVTGVISISGPTDLFKVPEDLKPYAEDFMGTSATANPDLWKEASPINYVASGAYANTKIALLAGGVDAVVLPEDTQAMYNALRDAHVETTYLHLGSSAHCLVESQAVRDAIIDDFLKSVRWKTP